MLDMLKFWHVKKFQIFINAETLLFLKKNMMSVDYSKIVIYAAYIVISINACRDFLQSANVVCTEIIPCRFWFSHIPAEKWDWSTFVVNVRWSRGACPLEVDSSKVVGLYSKERNGGRSKCIHKSIDHS